MRNWSPGEPIAVLVAGVGHLGKEHARVYKELDNVELVGVVDAQQERAREIGADLAIDYRQDDFCQAVLNATKGEGVHAILDLVCADYMDRNLRCLADDGRLIVVSFLGGAVGSVDFQTLAKRRQTICGSTLRPRSISDKGRLAREIRTHVWPLVERGLYVPVINSVHPLENVRDAHQEMEDGRHVGKIVLSVKP